MKFTYNFADINGKVPMIEFLDSLSIRERAKIFACIDKLIELKNIGLQPKENLSKHLEDGIFELRVSFENRIARSFYFYESEKRLFFTHGFVKKEQKTPKKEIERAKTIRKNLRGEI
ncbi:MAG: type II toxin-antitoxin system RelE/ParE family toxin [Nitrospirae bacterium]|nr:type II toxin-antitoxin system RelE/ParE family toxin [Nitrospirota bacterium]MBI4838173.1 type II toxin-antitoxin system RelE/ParE family toxin [Nitrospirota bacterium]